MTVQLTSAHTHISDLQKCGISELPVIKVNCDGMPGMHNGTK